jgi:hypothetical protein
MKEKSSVLVFLLVLGMATSGFSQGKVKFVKNSHYFGDLKEEDGTAEIIFPFENIGISSVILDQVKTSCGCTTPVYSRDSIAPGSQGFVKVKYNPLNRPGSFKKQIVVMSSGANKIHTLTISGRVIPRPKGPRDFYPFDEGNLRFRTNHLTYGRIYKDEEKTLSTIIYNEGERTIRFNRGKSIFPEHLQPRMSKAQLEPGDTLHLQVTYIGEKKDDWGFAFDNFFLATDDPDRPMKRFNVSADVLERFPKSSSERAEMGKLLIDKGTHDFGKVTDSAAVEGIFKFSNIGKGPLNIRKVRTDCSCVTVDFSEKVIPPGESVELRVRFDVRGRIGKETKDLVVICSDPANPQRILKLAADINRAE